MDRKDHYFYAVKLPSTIKQQLQKLCFEYQQELPFSRWVYEEDYHITLAFLGSATDVQLRESNQQIEEMTGSTKNFSLTMNQLGVFGQKDSPRIFWAGLADSSALADVRKKVVVACREAGFTIESRPFKPHITLARKWRGDSSFSMESIMNMENKLNFQFKAEQIVLYKTCLERVPKYEEQEIFTLQ